VNQQKYIISASFIVILCLLIFIGFRVSSKKKSQKPALLVTHNITNRKLMDFMIGKRLYENNCGACHGRFSTKDGPWLTLPGFLSRWPDKKELFAYIRNPEEVRKRNAYAKELSVIWGAKMRGVPNLTDQEIQSILDYMEAELTNEGKPAT
jgi:cytochrome c2